jgi:hypothetical protein
MGAGATLVEALAAGAFVAAVGAEARTDAGALLAGGGADAVAISVPSLILK